MSHFAAFVHGLLEFVHEAFSLIIDMVPKRCAWCYLPSWNSETPRCWMAAHFHCVSVLAVHTEQKPLELLQSSFRRSWSCQYYFWPITVCVHNDWEYVSHEGPVLSTCRPMHCHGLIGHSHGWSGTVRAWTWTFWYPLHLFARDSMSWSIIGHQT